MEISHLPGVAAPRHDGPAAESGNNPLMKVARDLETAFLSEMLNHAGLGKPPDTFGGGTGEAQYASFLRNAQAAEMTARGGIGLAEAIFESLKERNDE